MLKDLRKRTEGFTIIEVLIVLAIAGLILLIVFLAVPALQRNSRNTQRKNDVAAILGGVTEYANNNAGELPGDWDGGNSLWRKDSSATAGTSVKLGHYTGTDVTYKVATPTQTNANDPDKVLVVKGAKCNGSDSEAGSGRQVAALYSVESGSSNTPVCQDS